MSSMIDSYFSILMLFGTSQAILATYLLLKDKDRPYSNNMLALLVCSWGFSCYWFFAFIAEGNFFHIAVPTFIGPMLALTLFPPIYLYVKYLFFEHNRFQKKDHLHFLPIYIYIIFTLYLFYDSDFSVATMRKHEWYKLRRTICGYFATVQGPIYFIMTNRIIKLRQQKLKKDYSEIESRNLEWFQLIHYSFALVFIIGGISTILRSILIDPHFLHMAYHIVLALSLFYITIIIYKYPALFIRKGNIIKDEPYLQNNIITSTITNNHVLSTSHFLKSNTGNKENLIINKIEITMQEHKLYTNPNLSLNDLANAISESRNSISFALNNNLNKTFYNYINDLRIEESKRLLSDKKSQHFSIEGIAAQSGFKTMSVFYRFFKDSENITPAVFRRQTKDN